MRSRSSLRLEVADRRGVRRVEHVEASRRRTCGAAPRARATSRPCRAARRRRSCPRSPSANCSSRSTSSRMRAGLVEPAEPVGPRPARSRRSGRAPRSARRSRCRSCSLASAPRLARMPVEQLVERVDELLHALDLERLDDVVVVDARGGEVVEQLLAPRRRLRARCRRAPRRDPGTPRSSRAASCSPCRGRSAPRRTSRRGRPGSSSTSTPRADRCGRAPFAARDSQRGPANVSLEVLVGELRVGDPELALESLVAERLEPLVGLGVDARDEERRDRHDRRRVAAARDEPLEPAQVRLDDRLVALRARRSA